MTPLTPLLEKTVQAGASDLHLKCNSPPCLRRAGVLEVFDSPVSTVAWIEELVESITPARLKQTLHTSGEADFSHQEPGVGRFRVNVFKQSGTWALAFRHVKTALPDLRTLGLPPILEQIAGTRQGMILIAGPTGAGKSTALAAMVNHINCNQKRHIVTMEDPIEFLFEDRLSRIEQREIGIDTPSFQTAMRSVLRQDPDVIVFGEMRDPDSIAMALTAAETGHLVMGTLHTADAAQTISRVTDFFADGESAGIRRNLSANLAAVLCLRMTALVAGGQKPVVEIALNTPAVRKLIQENQAERLHEAIELGRRDGMQTFNHALLELYAEGSITAEEALTKAGSVSSMRMALRGFSQSDPGRILGS